MTTVASMLGRMSVVLRVSPPCGACTLLRSVPSITARSLHWSPVLSTESKQGCGPLTNGEIEENLEKMRKTGTFDKIKHPDRLTHFRDQPAFNPPAPLTAEPPMGAHALPHPIWTEGELHAVSVTHKKAVGVVDHIALFGVKTLRFVYDTFSGYNRNVRGESLWVNRLCFLETVAGVPGMVAAMVRHLHSLRLMRRDHGWIHTLLEEAENERMHLMTFMQLKNPGLLFRLTVMTTQGLFVTGFSIAYLISPRLCHRFVGYLEEEAVYTYTKLLNDMENGAMKHWNTQPAPEVAVLYWKLTPTATMKDVVLAIRADEAHHRIVNHTLGSMKSTDYNPYKPGE